MDKMYNILFRKGNGEKGKSLLLLNDIFSILNIQQMGYMKHICRKTVIQVIA